MSVLWVKRGWGHPGRPLKRLRALSPSLLIWPEQSAGWQSTSGGTLAATGQPVGLVPDLSQLGGKTLNEWLVTAPEFVENGDFVNTDGWTLSSATIVDGNLISTGTGEMARRTPTFTLQSNTVYQITIVLSAGTSAAASMIVRIGQNTTNDAFTTNGPGTKTIVIRSGTVTEQLVRFRFNGTGVTEAESISIKALPGNHLRAGTWASPSDIARATLTAGGALNFDGSNDYYSLLNAIPITEQMTVVRAFKRASAGIKSEGIATESASQCHDATWFTDNITYARLWDTSASIGSGSADTGTGSYVHTTRRNASTQTMRRNGTQISTGAAAAVSGAFSTLGRRSLDYNNGEISFISVFDRELTGADLVLVERIAASTNGAVI